MSGKKVAGFNLPGMPRSRRQDYPVVEAQVAPKRRRSPRRTASALSILLRMAANFPGLVLFDEDGAVEGTRDVPGAELVEWMSNELYYIRRTELGRQLVRRARGGSPR